MTENPGPLPPTMFDRANRTGMTLPEFARWVRRNDPCARCGHPAGYHLTECVHGATETDTGCDCAGFKETT